MAINFGWLGKKIEDLFGGASNEVQKFGGGVGNQIQRNLGQQANVAQNVVRQAAPVIQKISTAPIDFAQAQIPKAIPKVEFINKLPVVGGYISNANNQINALRKGDLYGGLVEPTINTAFANLPTGQLTRGTDTLANKLQPGLLQSTVKAPGDVEASFKNFIAQKPATLMSVTGGATNLATGIDRTINRPSQEYAAKLFGVNQAQIDANRNEQDRINAELSNKLLSSSRDYSNRLNQSQTMGNRDTLAFKAGSGLASVGQYAALNALGGPALAGGVGGAETYGQTAQESFDKTGKVDQNAALADALVTAATERLTGFIPGINQSKGILKGGLKGTLKNLAIGAPVEGLQEGIQQLSSNLIAKYSFDPERDPMRGVVEATLIGGAVGGSVGTVGGRRQYNNQQSNIQNITDTFGPDSGISKLYTAGYTLDAENTWINPKGKEASVGELQKITQPAQLTKDENLVNQGKMTVEQTKKDMVTKPTVALTPPVTDPTSVVSHTTKASNLDSILDQGLKPTTPMQLNEKGLPTTKPMPGYEGQSAVYMTEGVQSDYAFPGEDNINIVYKKSELPSYTPNGQEIAVKNNVPVTPKSVDYIAVPNQTLADKLTNKGFKTVVDPTLSVTPQTTVTATGLQPIQGSYTVNNQQNIVAEQAKEIANKSGANIADVQRNIQKFGYDATNNTYSQLQDTTRFDPETQTGVKSIDAVATAQLNKSTPQVGKVEKPKVTFKNTPANNNIEIVNNEFTDTSTGEIIKPPTTKVKTTNALSDTINNATDPRVATSAEAQQAIGDITQQVRVNMEGLERILQDNNHTFEEFSREIYVANKTNSEPKSKWAADLYNQVVKPELDTLYEASGVQKGQQKYYLPQSYINQNIEADYGGSIINLLDIGNEGFNAERQGKLSIDEVDHSINSVISYATKTASARYKNQLDVDRIKNQIIEFKGVAPEESKISAAQQAEESLSKEVFNASDSKQIFKNDIDKIDLVDKINNTGKLKYGESNRTIEKGSAVLLGQGMSAEQILDNYQTTDGNTINVAEESGFNRYTEDLSVGMIEDQKDLSIGEYLTNYYKDVDIPGSIKQSIINNALKTNTNNNNKIEDLKQDLIAENSNLNNSNTRQEIKNITQKIAYLENQIGYYESEEGKKELLQDVYRTAEKRISRNQMVTFLETTNIKNPLLKKTLNQEARRMLTEDKVKQSLSQDITRVVLGAGYTGTMGWNVLSAGQNLFEIKRAVAEFTVPEMKYALQMAATDPTIMDKYQITPTKVSDITETRGQIEKNKSKLSFLRPMAAFQSTENFKDKVMLHGFEKRHTDRGLTGVELQKAVRKDFDALAIKSGQRGTLGFNKTQTGRLLGQYLQYNIKSLTITGQKLNQAFGFNQTAQDRQQAAKYLGKLAIADTITYLIMNALIGSSWEYISGLGNPFAPRNRIDGDAPVPEQILNAIPAGQIIGAFKNLYLNVQQEQRQAIQQEREVDLDKVYKTEAAKLVSSYLPGGNQLLNKTGVQALLPDEYGGKEIKDLFPKGAIGDIQRGYNQAPTSGRARYTAPTDLAGQIKLGLFGPGTSAEARQYYNNTALGGLPIVGENLIGGKPQTNFPVSERLQKQIDEGANPADIIKTSKEFNRQKQEFKDVNPTQNAILQDISRTTYNPKTKKRESDIISPDKWGKVASDKNLILYDRLREKAFADNKQFGQAIDPIYELKDKAQIKTILELRSRFTGDDAETKQILKAKEKWFNDFTDKESKYYEQVKKVKFEDNPEYGNTERKQQYLDLSGSYPQQTDLAKKYLDIKNKDKDAGKAFYKNNADQLSADFKQNKLLSWEWTNKRRALEGAAPMSWDAYSNLSFGYEDDEKKLATELYFKGKEEGWGYDKSGNKIKGPESQYKYNVKASKAPKISFIKSATKAPSIKAKKISLGKPKVTMKKSRV